MNAIIPNNVPKSLAHGAYTNDPDRHFFLVEFHEMEDEMPSAQQFVAA